MDLKSGTEHYWHNPDILQLLVKLKVCSWSGNSQPFMGTPRFNSPQINSILRHMHPAHSFQSLFWIHFNIILAHATSTKLFIGTENEFNPAYLLLKKARK